MYYYKIIVKKLLTAKGSKSKKVFKILEDNNTFLATVFAKVYNFVLIKVFCVNDKPFTLKQKYQVD